MYKLQLIRKYLVKRRIAWVALVAVMLCTAMVLVVVSVMGGWLTIFVESFHGMTGDVVITSPSLTGFPHYQEMIDRVKKEVPDVLAAVPIIKSGGLLNIGNIEHEIVQVLGYPPEIGEVNNWAGTLHTPVEDRRKELTLAIAAAKTPQDKQALEARLATLPFSMRSDVPYSKLFFDRRAKITRPGMIVSSGLVGIRRNRPEEAADIRENIHRLPTSLTMVPVTGGEDVDTKDVSPTGFWIVDDSTSQIFSLDGSSVYISFDEAQNDLRMTAGEGKPARCSEVELKARPGTDLQAIKAQVDSIVNEVRQSYADDFISYRCKVETWQDQQGPFIRAVQHETVIVTALFGVISLVAVLLIFCIFYMIVVEKTKDIGIIKSVGATGGGILSLFLGYGFAIGLLGSGLGLALAYLIMNNINEIHAWLGRQMGIVLFDPETYQFDRIPSRIDPQTASWVLATAVVAALLGALIPAMRAAVMNPVDALRYE